MRTYIIENTKIDVFEEEIRQYALIYDDCYYKQNGIQVKYEGKLYFNEEGEVFDKGDAKKIVPEVLFNEEGEELYFNQDFFLMESTEGFLLEDKLYLVAELEEVVE